MTIKKGFTLIEILIALMVFSILATLTSSSLFHAFNTRTIVNAQTERLSTLQLALSIIEQDIAQLVPRAIRGNEMRLFPIMVGQSEYLEFTRQGFVNPNSIEKRSTLKRVALACLNGTLVHRRWKALDPKNRNDYSDKILIGNIKDCHFNYINSSLQTLSEWREQAANLQQAQPAEILPKAIQINLTLNDWGKINLLYIVPEGLYAAI